jgi:hypothetical protein
VHGGRECAHERDHGFAKQFATSSRERAHTSAHAAALATIAMAMARLAHVLK